MGRAKELMMEQQMWDDEKSFANYLLEEGELSSEEIAIAKKFVESGLSCLDNCEKQILKNKILTKDVPRCPRCGGDIEKNELDSFLFDGYCSFCSSNLDD